DGAHADALVDGIAAGLDDAFLEAPALAARILEVEVGMVDTVLEDLGERALQVRFVEAGGLEQGGPGHGQPGERWICDFHTPMLQQGPPEPATGRRRREGPHCSIRESGAAGSAGVSRPRWRTCGSLQSPSTSNSVARMFARGFCSIHCATKEPMPTAGFTMAA